MRQPERRGPDLRHRYTAADINVLSEEETSRFIGDGSADPQINVPLAWEILYRREPALHDRLAQAERLHPAVIDWLPTGVDRIVEVGAGTGRLTLELVGRAREVVAIEPVAPFRKILERKLAQAQHGCHFHGAEEAAELTGIFYPEAASEVRLNEWHRVPFRALGTEPPCDLAYKEMP